MSKSRMITTEELLQMSEMNNAQRLKFIRRLLNEIDPKEYTKKRVAERCSGITYQGLHFLEERGAEPREMTIQVLADCYGVPKEIFSDDYYIGKTEPFLLGKKNIRIESDDLEIFAPQYEVEVTVRVKRRIEDSIDYSEIKSKRFTEATAMDIEELDSRIEHELQHINARNKWNKRAREAFLLLKVNSETTGDQ